MVDAGNLEQVKRGLHRLTDVPVSTYDSLIQAAMSVPHGVICMLSALSYYNLTTLTPWEVSIAIEQGKKAFLPSYPPVKIYHFSSVIFSPNIITDEKQLQWHGFLKRSKITKVTTEFKTLMQDLHVFLKPLLDSFMEAESFSKVWIPEKEN